jgi:hypothetical protein
MSPFALEAGTLHIKDHEVSSAQPRRKSCTHLAGLCGMLTRLSAGQISRILDRIDQGLVHGLLLAHFPGGVSRMLGGRGSWPSCRITVHHWRAQLRLVIRGSIGWYQVSETRDWHTPYRGRGLLVPVRCAGHEP